MLTIKVKVPKQLGGAASVEVWSGGSRVAAGSGAASASADLATRHGNPGRDPLRPWGDAPSGDYQLLAKGPAPEGSEAEYGNHVLVFQPMGGTALEAEAFGRLLLLVYAGPAGKDGRLRPTQGGVRLQPELFDQLLREVRRDPETVLEI